MSVKPSSQPCLASLFSESLKRHYPKRSEARADSDGGRLTVATRPESLLPALGTKVRLDSEKSASSMQG